MNALNSVFVAAVNVSGDGMVQSLLYVLIIGICLGVIWFLGRYFMQKFGAPPPLAFTVWTAIFVLLVAVAFINFLLGMTGHPLVNFK
jgi:hypothetical protein